MVAFFLSVCVLSNKYSCKYPLLLQFISSIPKMSHTDSCDCNNCYLHDKSRWRLFPALLFCPLCEPLLIVLNQRPWPVHFLWNHLVEPNVPALRRTEKTLTEVKDTFLFIVAFSALWLFVYEYSLTLRLSWWSQLLHRNYKKPQKCPS
jgi:hypothetical protein